MSGKTPEGSSRYHLRGPAKPPSRYADSEEESREARSTNFRVRGNPGRPSLSPIKKQIVTHKTCKSSAVQETKKDKERSITPSEKDNRSSSQNNGDFQEESITGTERRSTRSKQHQSELSPNLRENLRRLKNVLKLPKARRWVYCEFFYSGVDQQLFLDEGEFPQLLHESFPNLRCRKLCRPEWRAIRRLIGKPRRCSQVFLDEERAALRQKRAKIRQIYDGTIMSLPTCVNELPLRLPRPLIVGAKIYARVRNPRDGIYAGTIDAILPDSYRVVFDKEEMIPPMIIRDCEVMSVQPVELFSLSYFIEQNRSTIPSSLIRCGSSMQFSFGKTVDSLFNKSLTSDPEISKKPIKMRDEKVGNFPVRMLVILVKLSKLLEVKRTFVKLLGELNTEAEKINLIADSYPVAFQERYAQVVIDLESINRQLQIYLSAVNEYSNQLVPQLSEQSANSRPEAIRKCSQSHAVQIVKHCNNGLNVQNKHVIDLITSLTALLLQIRFLGRQTGGAFDLNSLSESLVEIRKQIDPSNIAAFQDYVEVHMKHMHHLMLNSGVIANNPRA